MYHNVNNLGEINCFAQLALVMNWMLSVTELLLFIQLLDRVFCIELKVFM